MADPTVDVKTDQPSSSDQDVNLAVPSAATTDDVKTPDSSAEKPHEQAVPYDRFVEKVEEANRLKEELEILRSKQPAEPSEPSPPSPQVNEFDWGFDVDPKQSVSDQPGTPAPFATDDIEARLTEDLATKPLATLWPMMLEAARQDRIAARKLESQVRAIPDFNQYERDYYNVPEHVVQQTKQNDELVKYLLAKHRATLQGKAAPPVPPSLSVPPPTNGPPPTNVEELAEKYRKEGEARALAKMNQQRGMTSESTATYDTPQSDEPELDERGKSLYAKLGLTEEQTKKLPSRLIAG